MLACCPFRTICIKFSFMSHSVCVFIHRLWQHINCMALSSVCNLHCVAVHLWSVRINEEGYPEAVWNVEYCRGQILSLTLLLMMETIRQHFYWLASLQRQLLKQSPECLNKSGRISHVHNICTWCWTCTAGPSTALCNLSVICRLCWYWLWECFGGVIWGGRKEAEEFVLKY